MGFFLHITGLNPLGTRDAEGRLGRFLWDFTGKSEDSLEKDGQWNMHQQETVQIKKYTKKS
jgi:hypothetical protein